MYKRCLLYIIVIIQECKYTDKYCPLFTRDRFRKILFSFCMDYTGYCLKIPACVMHLTTIACLRMGGGGAITAIQSFPPCVTVYSAAGSIEPPDSPREMNS